MLKKMARMSVPMVSPKKRSGIWDHTNEILTKLSTLLLVRQKAKDIANLLQDDNRLREERRQRQQMRDRMAGVGDYMGELTNMKQDGTPNGDGNRNDDLELLKVMEESRRQAAQEEQKRRQG
jgi:hypothetical protein